MCPRLDTLKDRTGYIFEENGKWFARTTITDKNGKRRNIKRTAKTKSEAKEILKQLNRQIEDEGEKVVSISKLTFNDLADYYELHYAKEAVFVDNRKVEGMRNLVNVKGYLKSFRNYFGKMKLREITYGDIYSYRSERLKTHTRHKKPRKIASTNRELSYLRRMFNIALRQDMILKNPVTNGENLIDNSAERVRERILSLEDETKLLLACDNPQRKHLKPLLTFLFDTACRKSEAIQLVWRDVDLNRRLVTIQAMNTKTLKTRQVGITSRLFEELEHLWENSNKNLASKVFGINKSVRTAFSSACKEANIKEGGIDGFTLHSARHTALSRLAKNGLPLAMVSKVAGHCSPNFTYQKYLSIDEETLHQAASILDSIQIAAVEQNQNAQISELIN